MSYAIEATNLSKRFGRRTAVDQLTLQVPTGCVYGFLGPNGAGKTSTMRLLLGLLRPQAGSVRLLGLDLARDRIAAMRSVGALIETPALYEHLSGRANLDITRNLLRLPASEVGRVLALVELEGAADRRVSGYSLGMKQRLALGRALLGSPKLLLLDEPTNGLDPDGIVSMRDLIRDLPGRTGATVFMSSHLLSEVEQTATVAGLMSAGRLLLQKSVAELTAGRGLAFELNDPRRGAEVLSRDRALEIRLDGASGLHVALPQAADPREVAARCNRALVEDGLEVSAVSVEARSLEQTYRAAVAAQEGARA